MSEVDKVIWKAVDGRLCIQVVGYSTVREAIQMLSGQRSAPLTYKMTSLSHAILTQLSDEFQDQPLTEATIEAIGYRRSALEFEVLASGVLTY